MRPTFYGAPGTDIAAGDVDGDGDQDLVTAGAGDYAVLLNVGSGGFAVHSADDGDPVTRSTKVALGDIDEDGHTDMVRVAVEDQGDAGWRRWVEARHGDGAGTFGPPSWSWDRSWGPSTPVNAVELSDLNDDSHLDLIVLSGDHDVGQWHVHWLAGDGSGSFGPANVISAPVQLDAMALGDIDADGDTDIVATGVETSNSPPLDRPAVAVAMQGPAGQFEVDAQAVPGLAYGRANGAALADFDGDGFGDLATAVEGQAVTLRGSAEGLLWEPLLSTTDPPITWPEAAADVDGDGAMDVLNVHDQSGSVSFGDGAGRFHLTRSLVHDQTGGYVFAGVVTDLDGDHQPDAALSVTHNTTPGVAVFANRLKS